MTDPQKRAIGIVHMCAVHLRMRISSEAKNCAVEFPCLHGEAGIGDHGSSEAPSQSYLSGTGALASEASVRRGHSEPFGEKHIISQHGGA